MRALVKWLLSSRMPALTTAATLLMLSLLLPPLTLLSGAVIVLVTLEKGMREGINTVIASAMAAGLLGAIIFGNFVVPALYGLADWLPLLLAATLFRLGGASLTWALESLTLLAALLVALIYLTVGSPAEMWQNLFLGRIEQLEAQLMVEQTVLETVILKLAQVMTGFIAAAIALHFMLTFFLGLYTQGWLHGWRVSDLLRHLKPPRLLAITTLLLFALGFLGIEMALNLVLPLLAFFFVVGTVSIHMVLRAWRTWALWLFYIALFFIPHLMVPVAIVGVFDPWFDLRQRWLGIKPQT